MTYLIAITVLVIVIILLTVRVVKLSNLVDYWQDKYHTMKKDYHHFVKYTLKKNRE